MPHHDADVRLLEIVGEAASRVPARERAKYPGILWHIVTQDLPPLIVQLDKMLLAGPQS